MGMRLLPKSAVEKAKALDKQREIDEGKKLATHIDSLRTLAATEEKNLMDFRDKSLKVVQAEINGKLEEKNGLEHAVEHLKYVRKTLLEPLDAKWEEVNKAQQINNDWDTELSEREVKVTADKEANLAFESELAKKADQLNDTEERVKEVVAQAAKMIEDAKEVLAKARNDAQVSTNEISLKSLDLLQREENVAARERDAKNTEERNKKVRKENLETTIRLNDREAALERSFEELKRNKK